MKKIILNFIFLLVGVGMVNAQSAKEMLDKVQNKYQNAQTYYIKFDFEHQANGQSQKKSGDVYSSKQKFNLNVEDINQIYDAKKLYTIDKEGKEVVQVADKRHNNQHNLNKMRQIKLKMLQTLQKR